MYYVFDDNDIFCFIFYILVAYLVEKTKIRIKWNRCANPTTIRMKEHETFHM